MSKPEWGTKRRCPNCTTPFYDLGRPTPLHCPKCSHVFEPELLVKPRKARLVIKDDEIEADVLERDEDDLESLPVEDRDPLIMHDEDDADDEAPGVSRTPLEPDAVDEGLDDSLLLTDDLDTVPLDEADLLEGPALDDEIPVPKKKK